MEAASGMRSVAVAGDDTNSVVVAGDDVAVQLRVDGEDALLRNVLRGSQPSVWSLRGLPLDGLAPAPAEHLDRSAEVQAVRAGIGSGRVFELTGAREIGKTFVVRSALDAGAGMPDGSVYVVAKGKPYSDLAQELHEAFYESSPPAVVGRQRIRRDLAGRRALVVLDSIELERDELDQLAMLLPGCAIVLVGRDQSVGEDARLQLHGLAAPDALKLVEQELGRPLRSGEGEAAAQVCAMLGGHPYELRQAASGVRHEERTFDELAQALAGDPRAELSKLLLDGLTGEEAAIVARLAALRGASVGGEHLAEIAGTDLRSTLDALEQSRLIAREGESFRIAGTLHDHCPVGAGEPASASAHFARWARDARARPSRLLAEAPALLELLGRAGDEGRDADVIALGRACDAAFAWGRRWTTWGDVLDAVLSAAQRSGDESARAWALHQAGTLAYCLGDTSYAQEALQEALLVREMLGERDPAAATRYNLEFIAAPLVEPAGDGDRGGRRSDRDGLDILSVLGIGGQPIAIVAAAVALLVVVGVLGGVMALALGGGGGDSPDFVTTSQADLPTATTATQTQTQTTPVERFSLDVTVTGDGSGTVSIGSKTCRDRCSYELDEGTDAELIARPSTGSTFVGWTDPCATKRRCTVTIDGPRVVIATFTAGAPEPGCDEIVDPGCQSDPDLLQPDQSQPAPSVTVAPSPIPTVPPPATTPPAVTAPPATTPQRTSTTPRGPRAN